MPTVDLSKIPPPSPAGVLTRPKRRSIFRGALPAVLSIVSVIVAVVSAVYTARASQDAYVSDRRSELITLLADLDSRASSGEPDETADAPIAQAIWLVGTIHDGLPARIYTQIADDIVTVSPTYVEKALPLLDEAMRIAGAEGDEYEQVAALRVHARIDEYDGDLTAMRGDFTRAVALSAAYDGQNPQRAHAVPAFTHVFWGEAEVRAGACGAAKQQLQFARQDASFFTRDRATNLWAAIDGLAASIATCVTS